MTSSTRSRIGRFAAWAALAIGSFVVLVTALVPTVNGPLALAAILVAHLCIALVLVGLMGWALDRGRWSATPVLVLLLVLGVRFGQEWLSLPPAHGDGRPLTVMSWNLEVGSRSPESVSDVIVEHDADLVALQELTPVTAAALEDDARIRSRYPYRWLAPEATVFGMGILSVYPLLDTHATSAPPTLTATLDFGAHGRAELLNAHPLPGTIDTASGLRLPIGFDGTRRDDALTVIRRQVDDLLASGERLIVAGDFNVASTESAYRRLSAGLLDVHEAVGMGPGWSWRPSRLEGLGLGFLRIDYVFTDSSMRPEAVDLDCSRPGDHCVLLARLRLP